MNTSTIKNETVMILKELRQNIVDLEKQYNKMLNTYGEKEAIQIACNSIIPMTFQDFIENVDEEVDTIQENMLNKAEIKKVLVKVQQSDIFNKQKLKLMIEKGFVNFKTEYSELDNRTLMHFALHGTRIPLFNFLLENGMSITDDIGIEMTALGCAVNYNDAKLTKIVLEKTNNIQNLFDIENILQKISSNIEKKPAKNKEDHREFWKDLKKRIELELLSKTLKLNISKYLKNKRINNLKCYGTIVKEINIENLSPSKLIEFNEFLTIEYYKQR